MRDGRLLEVHLAALGGALADEGHHRLDAGGRHLEAAPGEEGRRAFNEKRPPNFTGALRRRGEAWKEPSEEDARRLDEAFRSGEF